ncbi:MAG TPA: hypothetical protein VFT79_02415 [Solirubrobacterales bacterium]|nr:hypothetical protein [Solirubrobacterales bacterium]
MPPDQERKSRYAHAVWVALTVVISLAIADALLAPTPAPGQPDFIDTIIASKAVVVAIRVAIVFAAVFLVLSVIALIVRRQWLTRVGPVEVEKVSDLDAKNGRLEEKLERAKQKIADLEQML